MFVISFLLTACLSFQVALAAPQVTLNSNQVVTGKVQENVEQFLGMPYAEPPLGDLRFARPKPYSGSYANFQAVNVPTSCLAIDPDGVENILNYLVSPLNPILNAIVPVLNELVGSLIDTGEDCLYINVYRPPNTDPNAKLPVMLWIFGGAYLFGSGAFYDGSKYVQASVDMGQPVILVTFNYRLGAFGFLGGTGIAAEGNGNAGLLDQRLAMEWVQNHITDFGGDPTKVTIFGESAGAMSTFNQLVANNGDNSYNGGKLFRAAIMQSGSANTFGTITDKVPQELYLRFANEAGCSGLATDADTLGCLRSKDSDTLQKAMNSFNIYPDRLGITQMFIGWSPRADGDFITAPTMELLSEGKIADVPYITGVNEDEGTLFGFLFNNVDNSDWTSFLSANLYNATADQRTQLSTLYPNDWTQGCPYDTGLLNAITPEYKRFSSLLNDILFNVGRRKFLDSTPNSKRYTFYADTLHDIAPVLGTFHANDLVWQWFLDIGPYKVYRNYFVAFANSLDPNPGSGLGNWPEYTDSGKEMLHISLNGYNGQVTDTFREQQISYIVDNAQSFVM